MALTRKLLHLFARVRCDGRGQATVELAVCTPVLLALAVVTVDLMVFLGDCVQFDRVSAESVRVMAMAPSEGTYGDAGRDRAVCDQIAADMGEAGRLSFEVTSDDASDASDPAGPDVPALLSMEPGLRRYTCTMRFVPWPLERGIFGVEVSGLEHVRTYVLDPYRPGVVV